MLTRLLKIFDDCHVVPPSLLYSKGVPVLPPVAVTVMVPVASPLQEMFVWVAVKVTGGGAVIVKGWLSSAVAIAVPLL